MDSRYHIEDTSEIISPGLVVFRDVLKENIAKMVAIAGDPGRLRPHCKTHKMRQVVELQVAKGVTKHKAATFAECEMLIAAGATDVFLAYSLVGPNIKRAVKFRQQYPEIIFSVTADHPQPIRLLGEAMAAAGTTIEVLLDLDTGQHRTGVAAGSQAEELYKSLVETEGLVPGGLHMYDGQNHQTDLEERRTAVTRHPGSSRSSRSGCATRPPVRRAGPGGSREPPAAYQPRPLPRRA